MFENQGRDWKSGQVAIILVILVLMVVGIVVMSITHRVRIDRRATSNFCDGLRARYIATAGLERAIAELRADQNHYDDLYEGWAQGLYGEVGEGYYCVGRSRDGGFDEETGVVDEASRLNVNIAGYGAQVQGWKTFELDLTALAEVGEARAGSILAYRHGKDGCPGSCNVDDDMDSGAVGCDGIDNDADGQVDEQGEGVDEPDEFRVVNSSGDDNPFETITELRRVPGIGQGTFADIASLVTVCSYDVNKNREGGLRVNLNHAPVGDLKVALRRAGLADGPASQLAANIVDFRDRDDDPTEFNNKLGVECTPYVNEVMPFFTTSTGASISQLLKGGVQYLKDCVTDELKRAIRNKVGRKLDIDSIVDDIVSAGGDKLEEQLSQVIQRRLGVSTRVENERAIPWFSFLSDPPAFAKKSSTVDIQVEWVELYNPYANTCHLGGWELSSSLGTRRLSGIIQPGGYWVLFNLIIILDGKKSGTEFLDNVADTIELVNGNDCCVDKATYSNYGVPWRSWERNDPRVREFAGYMPGGSPWCQNWYFMPDIGEIRNNEVGSSFYVRNGPFVSVGDIGYIHKGVQWRTLSLDKGGDWSLLDALTTSWPVEERVFGRININTAKRQVLESLPGIDSRLAEQIVRYGDTDSAPFDTPGEIAEVIGMQALGSNMWDDDGDGYVDEDDEVEALVRMVSNLITVRSNCFTVTTTGRVCRGNSIVAESKLEAVLDRGSSPLRTLYYRVVYENG